MQCKKRILINHRRPRSLEAPDAAPASVLPTSEAEPLRTVTLEEANDYLSLVQAACGRIAAGVGLCILCPIALLLLGAWADGTPREGFAAGAGMITLLVLVALLAMGKLGSEELTAASDLDLILLYDHDADAAASDGKRPLPPTQYYARLTQRRAFIRAGNR